MSQRVLSPFDLGGQKIVNVATPTASTDGATRAYVDAAGLGRWRGAWTSGTASDGLGAYITGDIATYNGSTYRANSTPTVGVAPINDVHWDVLSQAGAAGSNGTSGVSFTFQGAWVSGTPYLLGQWVSYNNNLYYCNGAIGNLAAAPNVDAGWNLAMTGSAAGVTKGSVPTLGMRATSYLVPEANSFANETTIAVDCATAAPLFVCKDTTADRIGVYMHTGVATAKVRLGIYSDDGSGIYPGALLFDGGQIDAAAAGAKEITLGSAVAVPAGIYWAVAKHEVAFAACRGNVGPVWGVPLQSMSSTSDASGGYTANMSANSGALAPTWPAWGVSGTGNLQCPARVGIRVTG